MKESRKDLPLGDTCSRCHIAYDIDNARIVCIVPSSGVPITWRRPSQAPQAVTIWPLRMATDAHHLAGAPISASLCGVMVGEMATGAHRLAETPRIAAWWPSAQPPAHITWRWLSQVPRIAAWWPRCGNLQQKSRSKAASRNLMLAGLTGLEPATSGVTGRRSNQLSYNPASTAKAILQKLAPFVKKEVKKTCGYGPRGQRPAYHQSDYASVVGVTPSLGVAACGLRSSRP